MQCDVDLTTGTVSMERIDFDLPGFLPLEFRRVYESHKPVDGSLGKGWSHSLDCWAEVSNTRVKIYEGSDEHDLDLRLIAAGSSPRFDRSGAVLQLSYPNGSTQIFHLVSGRLRLVKREDPFGNDQEFYYFDGKLTHIRNGAAQQIVFEYAGSTRLRRVIVQDMTGLTLAATNYHYDTVGYLISVQDCRGYSEHYEYRGKLLVGVTNKVGGATYFAYDQDDRCILTWRSNGSLVRTMSYDSTHRRTLATDAVGYCVLHSFDDKGLIISQTSALGAQIDFVYQPDGSLVAMHDQVGSMVEAVVSSHESLSGVSYLPSGSEIVVKRDEIGRVTAYSAEPGKARVFSYTKQGKLESVETPGGAKWAFRYSPRGSLAGATDPLGYELMVRDLGEGRGVLIEDDLGLLSEQIFDPLGNLLATGASERTTSRFRYDGPDSIEAELLPDGRTIRYRHNGEGQLFEMTDPSGRTFQYISDEFGNLAQEIDPLGNAVRYEYDQEENLTALTNAKGEVMRFRYDADGNEVERRFFDGISERFEYDARGRRIKRQDRLGRWRDYQYDDANRLVQRSLEASGIHAYEWDAHERLTSIRSHPLGKGALFQEFNVGYDDNGRVVKESHDGISLLRTYDPCGRIMAISDNWGGQTGYEYDQRHRLIKIEESDIGITFSWTQDDVLAEIDYTTGLRVVFDTDSSARLTGQTLLDTSGKILLRRNYEHDAADRIVRIDDSLRGTRLFQYDAAGRLVLVTDHEAIAIEWYAYDPNGNLIESHRGRARYAVGDRIVQFDNTIFEWDRASNRTARRDSSGASWSYVFDSDCQLVSVSREGELLVAFEYDLIGRRLNKSSTGVTRGFLYDGLSLRAERLHENRRRYIYVPGTDIVLAFYEQDQIFFCTGNHFGSPTEVWDGTGRLISYVSNEAFGGRRATWTDAGIENARLPFAFPGQYFDDETGLCYNTFRYYDPTTASFLSSDPLSILAAANHLAYANDPLTQIDPEGLLQLVFKCEDTPGFKWSACDKWVARNRVAAMNRALKKRALKKCKTDCRDQTGTKGKQKKYYEDTCGGDTLDGSEYQVDHFLELQVGGYDKCCANLVAIPARLNDVGMRTAVGRMLKGLSDNQSIPIGTKIGSEGCFGGKCSKKNKKKHMKRPPRRNCEEPQSIEC